MDPHEAIGNAFKHALNSMRCELEPAVQIFHRTCNASYGNMLPLSIYMQDICQRLQKNDKNYRKCIISIYDLINNIPITHKLVSAIAEKVTENEISVEEADTFFKTKIADIKQSLTRTIVVHENLLKEYNRTTKRVTERRNRDAHVAKEAAEETMAKISTTVAAYLSATCDTLITVANIFGGGILDEADVPYNNEVLDEKDQAFSKCIQHMENQTTDILTVLEALRKVRDSFRNL